MPSERVQGRIEEFLDEADEAARVKNWAAAGDGVAPLLALDPDNAEAISYRSMADDASYSWVQVIWQGVRFRLSWWPTTEHDRNGCGKGHPKSKASVSKRRRVATITSSSMIDASREPPASTPIEKELC